ncbi:hypothetical protein D3C78_778080 [compost metagenome]
MLFVVEQRIGVGHHAGGRVVASDGQRIAQRGRSRLREAARAVADHRDPFNGQGFQAIRCMHGEAAALGQCRSTRTTAIAQVFLINSQFAAFDIQAFQGHRVVEVIDVDLQRRGATVAVGILEGVGEGFNAGASTVDEVRVGSVQRVGIGAVGGQYQLAVGALDGLRCDRSTGDAVSALGVVGQHITSHGQLTLGGGGAVDIVEGLRRVIDDIHIDRAVGCAAIGVSGDDCKVLAQGGAIASAMGLVVEQRIGVSHHPRAGIIASDGQGVAFRRRG